LFFHKIRVSNFKVLVFPYPRSAWLAFAEYHLADDENIAPARKIFKRKILGYIFFCEFS